MANQRIILTNPIEEAAADMLSNVAEVHLSPSPDEETMIGLLESTVGIVARGDGFVNRRMIESCPTLRVIGRPGAGYDAVDVVAATSHGIPVVFAPVGGFAVAEGALAMLLALVKKVYECDHFVKSNQWHKRHEFATGDMAEQTLGIVGLGRIGLGLARLAKPFGMTLLGYDPFVKGQALKDTSVQWVELEELLHRSDYVSFHLPLSDETRGLVNRERIAIMKKGAILINTARGAVIESLDVLAEALETGQLSYVGLDVFPTEPPDTAHRIFKDSRCLCAPHMAGASELSWKRVCQTMAKGMIAVLRGGRPEYCVNPEVFDQCATS